MGSFWSVVHMLYCPTEKEMPCGLRRPIQMSLDITGESGLLASSEVHQLALVLACLDLTSITQPWNSFLLNTDQLISLLKWRGILWSYIFILSDFFFNIIFLSHEFFCLLEQMIPVASHSWYCLLFYLVVIFLFTTKQEADVVTIDAADYLDKNLTWHQFMLELPSQQCVWFD